MKEVNIRDLQLAELEILKEFIRVCKELNLRYYLYAGTLLGCIRHQGFIPWDDDIDVCMPRKDYEVFLQKGQAILKDKYFLQNYKTDKEYTANFSKIRNSETTFIECSVKDLNINHGVYIDIFPLDGYRPEKKFYNIKRDIIYAIHKIYISRNYNLKNTKRLKIRILKILQKITEIIYGKNSTNKIIEKEDKIAQKCNYDDCEYISSYEYAVKSPDKIYVPKNYLGGGATKVFEGVEVNVPENYDEYLTRLYGDYMQLPPEEKRVAHHYNEGVDLNKSYKEYIKENTKN